jgi:serine/threonine-protein kinase RsbW
MLNNRKKMDMSVGFYTARLGKAVGGRGVDRPPLADWFIQHEFEECCVDVRCDPPPSNADTPFAREGLRRTVWRWQLLILRCRSEIVPAIESVLVMLARLGYSARDSVQVRLALEEALVNGVRHGNGDDPAKCVRLRYCADRASVMIEVEDDGPGFDPDGVPDPTTWPNLERPTGRGLLLMRHCMTWVRFTGRGNRVTMCKRKSADVAELSAPLNFPPAL